MGGVGEGEEEQDEIKMSRRILWESFGLFDSNGMLLYNY